ncbi:TPA: sodium-transporting two-sector ATPase [Candidatus Saccharibacteria bacterium]|nr:sodium-transporting two-sector ATPase [Candidatus Saccharibacteria bacterium]HIO88069.1 sodium-transporting two-sector ATPase [Candidatus Saccharibacteria bacterium]
MSDKHFKNLVERQKVLGEVIAVEDFLVRAKGLQPIQLNALVMFEDGSKGLVREVRTDHVVLLHLGTNPVKPGMSVVLQHHELVAKIGKDFIGRVVSPTGQPLDGKEAIAPDGVWPVFREAPPLIKRQELADPLETGVTLVDTLFPVVLGQRIAILGDSKSGKSTFLSQIAINQKNTDRIVVLALVAKRKAEIDALLQKLEEQGAMENVIVVVSTIFDSLVTSYLTPYVACAMAEHLWLEENRDVIIMYDDLTTHAQIYREISLLSGVSPGRDSYPGDMFFAHSSLLERAGRVASNGKTLSSIPVVLVPGGDATAYLPTNIMSITDGQIIFDLDIFRSGIKPAVNTGLSVSRVGGLGQTKNHKTLATVALKRLAAYHQAAEFAHFGSELALEAQSDLEMGKRITELFTQGINDAYSLMAQEIMLDIVLNTDTKTLLDINDLKKLANEKASQATDEASYKKIIEEISKAVVVEVKK